ncbi:unnamed protein product, partial [Laminaria digitata]
LLLFTSVCYGLVETCEELQAAFDLTKTQNVVIEVHPFVDIDCINFTTMSMDSNTLTVESSENLNNFSGDSNLRQVRFEVTNGAKLYWETNAHFHGTETNQDVDGGGVFVGEGSTLRFMNNLEMTDVGVRSVPEAGSDFASYELSGGCVYTDGYFRVDGEATFTSCEVTGGGESSPGPGGALYVGEKGSVLFNGDLEISDVSITDDEGNNGGGIYNKGKVNIKGDATFDDLRAESGGAIYNAAGAQFRFKNGTSALFTDCSAFDGIGGALYNLGLFKFSGQAVFVNTDAPSIYVGSTGRTVLSENSSFGASDDTRNPAILVFTGGELDIPSSVSFV